MIVNQSQVFANEIAEKCTSKHCFPVKTTISDDVELELVGIALFRYTIFNVYSLALYAESSQMTSDQVLKDTPRKLVFAYHRSITADQMIEGARENLIDNPNIDITKFEKELSEINALYSDVNEDDIYELSYIPNVGTSLANKEKILGTIAGADFSSIYFGIWLSDYPLSSSIKNQIFGK